MASPCTVPHLVALPFLLLLLLLAFCFLVIVPAVVVPAATVAVGQRTRLLEWDADAPTGRGDNPTFTAPVAVASDARTGAPARGAGAHAIGQHKARARGGAARGRCGRERHGRRAARGHPAAARAPGGRARVHTFHLNLHLLLVCLSLAFWSFSTKE